MQSTVFKTSKKIISNAIIEFNIKRYLPLLVEWDVIKVAELTDKQISFTSDAKIKRPNTVKQLLSLLPIKTEEETVTVKVFNSDLLLRYVFDLIYRDVSIKGIIQSFAKKDPQYEEFINRLELTLQLSILDWGWEQYLENKFFEYLYDKQFEMFNPDEGMMN
ncbi:MAG: hypothetical protein ACP5JP_10560 [bacterium]